MSQPNTLEIFVQCLKKVPDPRSKRGTSYPFPAVLAVVLLGLIANLSTFVGIERWGKIHSPRNEIKENQGQTLKQMTLIFEDAPKQEPSDVQVDKKRGCYGSPPVGKPCLLFWGPADYIREQIGIPGCRAVLRL